MKMEGRKAGGGVRAQQAGGAWTKTGQPSCFWLFNGKCEAIFVFLLENIYLGTNFKFNSC